MSFGFIRKQSPASIAEARRRAAGRLFKVLHNLKIDEVSSVDRGAGEGVRVVLMKRDTAGDPIRKWDGRGQLGYRGFRYVKGDTDMPTLQERIAKSHTAAVRGEISFTKAALEQQQRAMDMFPQARSLGEALRLYEQTAIGKKDIHTLKDLQFLKQQWDTRLGNGAHAVLKSDSDGTPRVHFEETEDRGGAVDDGDDQTEESWSKRIQRLVDKHNISHDAAASIIHRAEKMQKARRGID